MEREPLRSYLERVEEEPERRGRWMSVIIVIMLLSLLAGLVGISAYFATRFMDEPNALLLRLQGAVSNLPSMPERAAVVAPGTEEIPLAQPVDTPTSTGALEPEQAASPEPAQLPEVSEPASLRVDPGEASPGSSIEVTGLHWPANENVRIVFVKPEAGQQTLELDPEEYDLQTTADDEGTFETNVLVLDREDWDDGDVVYVVAFTTDQEFTAARELTIQRVSGE